MNRIDLDGRVAIVTGAARGIGHAIAARFAASGATVVGWDIDAARLAAAARAPANAGTVATDVVDVTEARAVADAVARTRDAHGRIDILVNNAGAVGTLAPVAEQSLANWRRMLDLNLTSAFIVCQAVVPVMVAAGYGRIVNIASNAAKMGVPDNAPYAAAKAGLVSLTKTLAREVVGAGVLVNAITPGGANTELFDALSDAYRAQVAGAMPIDRLVEPDEIAALAAWLASADCSASTGAAFDISGGRADY